MVNGEFANAGVPGMNVANIQQEKVERYIRNVYENIDFNKVTKLSFQAFHAGYYGYLNLIEAGKLNSSSLLTICDFTLSSNRKRMWVMDVQHGKVLFNALVAHGMGTGDEYATAFSNMPDSHQSSLGFYITGETYEGNNGYSLKLQGVDGSFNSNAYDRAIVIHGAAYVCESFACANKRIGRSYGCPALPADIAPKVIDKIKDGNCLFIYSSSDNYLISSYWLRNKVKQLPFGTDEMELLTSTASNSSGVKGFNSYATNKEVPRTLHDRNKEGTLIDNGCGQQIVRNDKQTADIKKESGPEQAGSRIISSIMVINENRGGMSDTLIVR